MSKLNRVALFLVTALLIGTGIALLLSCTPKSPIDPTSSIGEGVAVLTDMQAFPSSIAVGTSSSTIRVRLLNDSGSPLSGKSINFTTSLGTLSASSAVTDTNGWAEIQLYAGSETGTAKVTASYQKSFSSVEINIISRLEAQIQLTSARSSILASGIDTTTIRVVVLGDSAKPITNESVTITSSVGSVSYSGTTDDQGVIKAVYTSPARTRDTTAVISAQWDTLASSIVLGLRGVTFIMESSSDAILADGSSSAVIRARLKETSTNIAIPDGEVKFGTTLGSIPASATTNSSGVAEVKLISEKKAGTAEIVGRYGDTLLDTVFVNFTESTYSVGITASPGNPLANGIDKCKITVEVRDASGNSAAGVKVNFSTSLSTIDSVAYTNSSGLAVAEIEPVVSNEDDQVATVSIRVDGVIYEKQVTFSAVQQIIQADPNIIVANGQSTSKISVHLKRKTTQVAIYGAEVIFATDKGTIENSATTDSKGVAEATLKSDNEVGVAHVVVRYGNLPPDTVLVTFTGETSGYAISGAGYSKSSILANGFDKSTIYVNVVNSDGDPASGVVISFATNHGYIASQAVTNSDGTAQADLVSSVSGTDVNAIVTAMLGSQTVQIPVLFEGIEYTLTAQPNSILADGESKSVITFSLKKTTSHIAVSGAVIGFGTTAGTIPNQGTTNSEGIAQVELTSSTTPGVTAVVSASYGNQITLTQNVSFVSEVPANYVLNSITYDQGDYLANGFDQVPITVKVEDDQGNAVAGVVVSFTTTVGSVDPQAATDENGLVKVNLTAPVSSSDVSGQVTALLGTQSLSTDQIDFAGIEYTLTAYPDSILADGKSTSRITFSLKKTTSHVAVSNAVITFGTTAGTIPNQATTNSQGIAEVDLTSSTSSGVTAVVSASYGTQITVTENVVFTSEAPSTNILKELNYTQGEYLANGFDQVAVTASVEDNNGNPVQGEVVLFSTTTGTIPSQGITDSEGKASVMLTAPASVTTLSGRVTASLGTQSLVSGDITFAGVTVEMTALPDTIIANGNSTSDVRVVLKRTDDHVAISGAPVTFATDYGTIPNQKNTDSQGVAEVQLTSSVEPHTATVVAQYGPSSVLRQSVNVVFRESTPTYLDLSATPPVIPADGSSSAIIKASVSDVNHNPVPDGTVVTFSLRGSGTIESRKLTNDGVASSTLIAGVLPDTAMVYVSVGTLSDSIRVIYQVGDASKVLVSTSEDTIKADGQQTAQITAKVLDAQGNEVPYVTVTFEATIGDITPSSKTDANGIATVQFSSGVVGISSIKASVTNATGSEVYGIATVVLIPGDANTIRLSFDPEHIGVQGTGQNQTTTIFADVRDAKNNPVKDGTMVQFEMVAAPNGCTFSSNDPKPTVGGVAQISFTSGTRSGNARIKAVVLDENNNPMDITAASTEILIHAGPPYIEDINDPSTSHLTVFVKRANIWSGMDTTVVSILVGDKYNNPVDPGTAVYLTTSGGVITTQSFTDAYGIVNDTLIAGQPYPTIDRYYNYVGMQDPNLGTVLPGPVYYPELGEYLIPNFEQSGIYYPAQDGGSILNSEGNTRENDGMAHIIAYSEGMDADGNSAKAWAEISVVISTPIDHFYIDDSALPDTLHPGESATAMVELWDTNGNPISAGSTLLADNFPGTAPAVLSWNKTVTGNGWGTCFYPVTISNAVDPSKPKEGYASIKVTVQSPNGDGFVMSKNVFIASE